MLTFVWRHRKENLKKCSLRGLEARTDMRFFTYPIDALPNLEYAVVLSVDGPPLSGADVGKDLLLIDGTWRYAEKMLAQINVERRSLPTSIATAYPRRQNETHGLASIEALYAAYRILGQPTDGLLDNYHWREEFLIRNHDSRIF